jgi:hypothetical protein
MCGALSDESTACRLKLLLALAGAVIFTAVEISNKCPLYVFIISHTGILRG